MEEILRISGEVSRSNLLHKWLLYMSHTKKTNNAQTIKGNQTGTLHVLSGSLVTYQCGEAVVNGKDQMPEP